MLPWYLSWVLRLTYSIGLTDPDFHEGAINLAIEEDRLKPNEGMRLLAEHERGLTDRTYLSVPSK